MLDRANLFLPSLAAAAALFFSTATDARSWGFFVSAARCAARTASSSPRTIAESVALPREVWMWGLVPKYGNKSGRTYVCMHSDPKCVSQRQVRETVSGILYGLFWKGSRGIVRSAHWPRVVRARRPFNVLVELERQEQYRNVHHWASHCVQRTIHNATPVEEGWKNCIVTSPGRLDCRRCTVAYRA